MFNIAEQENYLLAFFDDNHDYPCFIHYNVLDINVDAQHFFKFGLAFLTISSLVRGTCTSSFFQRSIMVLNIQEKVNNIQGQKQKLKTSQRGEHNRWKLIFALKHIFDDHWMFARNSYSVNPPNLRYYNLLHFIAVTGRIQKRELIRGC